MDLQKAGAAQSWTHHQYKASSCNTSHGKACCQSRRTASLGNHEILQGRPAKKKKKKKSKYFRICDAKKDHRVLAHLIQIKYILTI